VNPHRNGEIYYWDSETNTNIKITRENSDDHSFQEWEFLVLERGPEQIAEELEDALREAPEAALPPIQHRSAVKTLARPVKPGAQTDPQLFITVLDELAAISEAAQTLLTTVNGLATRLQSLVITVGRASASKTSTRAPQLCPQQMRRKRPNL
jgi:hypothetical protein